MKGEPEITINLKNQYEQDYGTHILVWDNNGNYIGQWQEDMLSDDGDGGKLFLHNDGKLSVPRLTKEQMEQATR